MVGPGCDDQFEFEFALDLLLDGIERLQQFLDAMERITISTKKPKCCGSFCKAIWRCTSSTRVNPSSTNIGMN